MLITGLILSSTLNQNQLHRFGGLQKDWRWFDRNLRQRSASTPSDPVRPGPGRILWDPNPVKQNDPAPVTQDRTTVLSDGTLSDPHTVTLLPVTRYCPLPYRRSYRVGTLFQGLKVIPSSAAVQFSSPHSLQWKLFNPLNPCFNLTLKCQGSHICSKWFWVSVGLQQIGVISGLEVPALLLRR